MSENSSKKKRTTADTSERKSSPKASQRAQASKKSAGRSSGTRKATRSSSGTNKRKQDKRTIDKKKSFIRSELAVIIAAFFGLFLFLCNFNILGVVGAYVASFEKGLFGMTAYALPILILVTIYIYIKEKGSFLSKLKLVSCIAIILILSAIMQLLFGGDELISAFDYYREAARGALGGGMVGGVLAGMLRGLTGDVGAYLILIALFIICMVIVTEKSFINVAKHSAEKTVDMAKEQHERYREACEENKIRRRMKKEEERLSRIEKDFPYINLENIQNEDADGQQRIDEEALSRAIAEQAKLYAEFGRDIIGPEQVDTDIVKMPDAGNSSDNESNLDNTTVISSVDTFTGTITMPNEYDYSIDEVPFEEDPHEKYISYDYINGGSEQVIDLKTAAAGGYADIEEASDQNNQDIINLKLNSEIKNDIKAEPELSSEEISEKQPLIITEDSTEIKAEDDYSDCDFTEQIYQTAQGKDMTAPSAYEADKILKNKKAEKEKINAKNAENAEATETIINKVKEEIKPYEFPPVSLLTKGSGNINTNQSELRETAVKLQQVLHTFGVGVTVTNVTRGPSVTRYEMAPDIGVKVSKITSLSDDIKLALAASDIRIEAPIPGKAAVGIEVPNKKNTMVHFRDIIETDEFKNAKSKLSFGIGKDIQGQVVVGNIAKMPHVLIAGATGSGKSVGINTLIMSLIYKAKPEDVRLIMIDPKVVELSVYNGIPHLLIPVVTDAKKAVSALNWAVAEMNERYKRFAETGTRNLSGYNEKIEQISAKLPEEERPKKLPQIVIIIDELAELMMTASKEVEADIVRLAQLARAAGMHLVIATQRPSVDVITGLIKANIPSRIAFKTSSGVDSRTILDMVGAETLLGNGDMLYAPVDAKKPVRIQGAFISDEEVERVVEFLTRNGKSGYEDTVSKAIDEQNFGGSDGVAQSSLNDRDEYFEAAGMLITEKGKASIGMLQRMFKIGFNRAARIMDQLYEAGVVGEDEGTKPRKVLMSTEEFKKLGDGI